MGTAENKQLLQDIFAATARGDSRPLVEAMAEDFRWTIAGDGKWARTYDKQAVLTELFPALRARIEGRIKMIPQRVLGDGDHVVVEARGDNVTKAGAPYNRQLLLRVPRRRRQARRGDRIHGHGTGDGGVGGSGRIAVGRNKRSALRRSAAKPRGGGVIDIGLVPAESRLIDGTAQYVSLRPAEPVRASRARSRPRASTCDGSRGR